eukprot:gene20060-biopygen14606
MRGHAGIQTCKHSRSSSRAQQELEPPPRSCHRQVGGNPENQWGRMCPFPDHLKLEPVRGAAQRSTGTRSGAARRSAARHGTARRGAAQRGTERRGA